MRVTLVICLKHSCPTSRPSLQNRQGTQKQWSLYALRQVLWTIALGLSMSDKVASGFPTLWPPGVEGSLEKLHGQPQGPCQRIFFAYFVFIPIKKKNKMKVLLPIKGRPSMCERSILVACQLPSSHEKRCNLPVQPTCCSQADQERHMSAMIYGVPLSQALVPNPTIMCSQIHQNTLMPEPTPNQRGSLSSTCVIMYLYMSQPWKSMESNPDVHNQEWRISLYIHVKEI